MKNFLIKLFFFLFLPILSFLCTFEILKIILERKISKSSVIILGDSQTEFLNLPDTFNHSINGSPYFVHYALVKEFEDVIHDKKIYLSVNYHNLSNLYENRLKNDSLLSGWSKSNTMRINDYRFLNQKFKGINENDKVLELSDLKGRITRLAEMSVFTSKKKNSENNVQDTTTIAKTIYRQWQHPKYIFEDNIQRSYLDKLINILQKNGNEIIILKMPVTSYYYENVPIKIKNELEELSENYNIEFLDLNKILKLSQNYNLFKDYGHLNRQGDSIVRKYFLNLKKTNLKN